MSARGLLSRALTVLVWTLLIAAVARIALSEQQYQWDFRVFHAAPAVLEGEQNPYDRAASGVDIPEGLSYLYPPIVLYLFKPLAELSFPVAYMVWFGLKLAALIGLLWLWHRHFEPLSTQWPTVAFLALAFNSAVLRDLTAGNIAIIEQLGLWSGFYLLLKNRPYLAGAVLAATAQVKLMPVVFLGLLFCVGPGRGWRPFVAAMAIFLGLLSLNYVFMPEMMGYYVDSFASANPNLDERGEINPSSLSMLRDIAAVLISLGIPWSETITHSFYLLFVAILGIAGLLAVLRHSDRLQAIDQRVLIYLACALFVLVMPRVKDYTYVALLLPALFVLRHADVRPMVPLLAVLLFLPPTDSYVPGLGRSLVQWVHSYIAWFAACFIGFYLVRHIRLLTRPRTTALATEPGGEPRREQ